MAKLVVLSEGFTGLTYELKVDKTTIGRVEDNAFQIPEQSVSSHHCEIVQRGNDLVVKDLNSTNGTFVNGEQVTETVLKPGQILRLGQVEMRLESGTGSSAPASAKKPLDKTMVIPQGVKAHDLDQGTRPVNFETNAGFSKKTNKANKVFITVGIIFFVLIVAFIILAFLKFKS
jgi:pSer/pThr/pTyr-binding forkhead associated (FHA) protein